MLDAFFPSTKSRRRRRRRRRGVPSSAGSCTVRAAASAAAAALVQKRFQAPVVAGRIGVQLGGKTLLLVGQCVQLRATNLVKYHTCEFIAL